jgi:precorrin-2 dehydrogenase / sirohydrochlorin ferrochelatase
MTSAKPPAYYPLFLDLSGRRCLVVGGGSVAERKVKMLLACDARVTVVAPRINRGLRRLAEVVGVKIIERAFRDADVRSVTLVFAATNARAVNAKVREAATTCGILVNVADDPELCDFIVPSIVRKGPIVVAISTSGTLPMLAKKLRLEIEATLLRDHVRYATKVGWLRKLLMSSVKDRAMRQTILRDIRKASVSEIASMSMKDLKKRFLSSS